VQVHDYYRQALQFLDTQGPSFMGSRKAKVHTFYRDFWEDLLWVQQLYPGAILLPVFPPDCAIAGILRWNQRWPPEKRKRANLALSFYKAAGLTQV